MRADMGTPKLDPTMRRWLRAEGRDEESPAELALAELFAALPRPVAPGGFGDRVLARLAMAPAPWPLERAALWLLLVCGAALTLLPRWLPAVGHWLAPESLVAGFATLLVAVAHWLATVA